MLSKAFLVLSALLLVLSGCSISAFAHAPTAALNDTDFSKKFQYVEGRPHSVGSTPDGHSFGPLPGPSPVRQSQIANGTLQADRPVYAPQGNPYTGHY